MAAPRPVREPSARGELMHEGHALAGRQTQYDEYFYPLPLKCIGEPNSEFWERNATSDGMKLLKRIVDARRAPLGDGREVQANQKKTLGQHFGDVTLNLADGVGYYEILRSAKDVSEADNVLVGYSQGGTVAHFLAFLDEHVVHESRRCVQGIVTVQAPHRGSPLASPERASFIAKALVESVLALLRMLPADPAAFDRAVDLNGATVIAIVNQLLDGLMCADGRSGPNFLTWESARKWLSGVSDNPHLAFWDLDPARLKEPDSVLALLESKPVARVRRGAVIGTDHHLHDLLFALVDSCEHNLKSSLLGWLEKRGISLLHSRVDAADDILSRQGLAFAEPPDLVEQYTSGEVGTLKLNLGIRAHDFVIPSVSQVLFGTTGLLGNEVNPKANHLSGAARSGETSDLPHVIRLLEKM
jgi:hypothetical protein